MLPKGFKFTSWRYSKFDSPTDPGSPIKKTYSGRYDKNGVLVLDYTGDVNIYDEIQSYAAECDINNIMNRYMAGDTDVLSRVQGFYFDCTQLPDNMPDLLNKFNYAQEQFENLPADFKEQYGNDFAQFICTFDPSVFSDMDDVSSVSDAPVLDEQVKEGD